MAAVFPGSVSTQAQLRVLVNNTSTQLNGSITNSATTISVDSTTAFPSSGYITIDSEAIAYTGKTSTTFTGCTRASDNTTAATHADRTLVNHYFIADHHNHMADELIAVEQNISNRFGLSATQALHADGSNSLPCGAFANSPTTGFYRNAADEVAWAFGGTKRMEWGLNKMLFGTVFTQFSTAFMQVRYNSAAAPIQMAVINDDNTTAGSFFTGYVAQVGGATAGDPGAQFIVSGATTFSLGIDNSDSDKFKISKNATLGTNDYLTIDTSGNVVIPVGSLTLTGLTATTVPYLDASKVLTSSAVTPTELGYVSGVTSAIQTQLGTKAPTASPTFTGTAVFDTATFSNGTTMGSTSNISTGAYLRVNHAGNSAVCIDGDFITERFGGSSAGFYTQVAGGTFGSQTLYPGNTEVGFFAYQAHDGVALRNVAFISVETDGTPASGSMPGRIKFQTTPSGSTTLNTRLWILANGNVTPGSDNTQSMGVSGTRWKDLWAGNGTVQTSMLSTKTNVRDMNPSDCKIPRAIYFTRPGEKPDHVQLGFAADSLPDEAHPIIDPVTGARATEDVYTSSVIAMLCQAARNDYDRLAAIETRLAALEKAA